MKSKTIIGLTAVITSSFLLSACTSSAPYWYKEGVSAKDTRSYYKRCIYNIGMNKIAPEEKSDLMEACMEKEGFRLVR